MWRRLLLYVSLAALAGAGCDSRESLDKAPARGNRTGLTKGAGAGAGPDPADTDKATAMAKNAIIVDGHIDVPYRLNNSRDADGNLTEDISERTKEGDFDYPRAVAGGLDAPFMSIYIPSKYQKTGGAKKLADELIDMVEGFIEKHPDKFAKAHSVADVRENHEDGKVSLPMGMENGAGIEKDLKNLKHFYNRGIRYITLTHATDNAICDSSYDDSRTHKGLSAFGKKVVPEMNRLGIMIDVSHVSDDAFFQVMELTRVPVIASHSSCRHFTPNYERNMSDEMIKKLGRNGGVIMINFGSSFINDESRAHFKKKREAVKKFQQDNDIEDDNDPRVKEFSKRYDEENPPRFATVGEVADHVQHVVKLVGIDAVGFGSDFDGVGDTLPVGLKDVSMYPNLIAELLERGYNEADIAKMAGGNVLRVWNEVEDYAAKQK